MFIAKAMVFSIDWMLIDAVCGLLTKASSLTCKICTVADWVESICWMDTVLGSFFSFLFISLPNFSSFLLLFFTLFQHRLVCIAQLRCCIYFNLCGNVCNNQTQVKRIRWVSDSFVLSGSLCILALVQKNNNKGLAAKFLSVFQHWWMSYTISQ